MSGQPKKQLSLFDTTNIIVGIIVGAGIYQTTPLIAANVGSPAQLIGVWVFGGLTALISALCYVELATSFPREGGDYVFLSQAYHKKVGFLFAWAEFWIIRPGNVGMMAFVFAKYANEILPLGLSTDAPQLNAIVYAVLPVVLLTALNLLGVRSGKTTQNLLTVLKIVGLVIVAAIGLMAPAPTAAPAAATSIPGSVKFAVILAMFTYGGWNEMANVAAEVRDPHKNILRSLVIGVSVVTLIYVLVNLAFLNALGLSGVAASNAVAADVTRTFFPNWGGRLISVLVCVSCLGAINGMLLTGSRILFAVGNDHGLFRWLGSWNLRWDAPVRAFLLQAVTTVALIGGLGWLKDGFDQLLIFTTPIYWSFALLVAGSLFIFRTREVDTKTPYRTPLFPLLPLVFGGLCIFLLYASASYAYENRSTAALAAISILALGVVASFLKRRESSE